MKKQTSIEAEIGAPFGAVLPKANSEGGGDDAVRFRLCQHSFAIEAPGHAGAVVFVRKADLPAVLAMQLGEVVGD